MDSTTYYKEIGTGLYEVKVKDYSNLQIIFYLFVVFCVASISYIRGEVILTTIIAIVIIGFGAYEYGQKVVINLNERTVETSSFGFFKKSFFLNDFKKYTIIEHDRRGSVDFSVSIDFMNGRCELRKMETYEQADKFLEATKQLLQIKE